MCMGKDVVQILSLLSSTPTHRYTDVHQYHAVFRPLVAMEAEYDRAMKESQSRDNITLRWDWGLNHKRVAYFLFPKDDTELRLVPGDELRLCHRAAGVRGTWEGTGCVLRFDQSEEVCLEMNSNVSGAGARCTRLVLVTILWLFIPALCCF